MKYRKKPVVIEAVNTSEMIIAYRNKEFKNVPDWVRKAVDEGTITLTALVASVKTLEGEMLAWHTDMLIQGINGEIYPCKIDIFEATYEPFRRPPHRRARSRFKWHREGAGSER